jgi:2-polyprenyl-6-hydroxyphenyl methylase / 3-demethylubiquinone-9 3-methyltransferase
MIKLTKFSENRSLEDAKAIYDQRIKDSILVYKKFKSDFFERNCPCCNSKDYSSIDKFHDTYNIAICKKCLTKFVNPSPSQSAINYFYNDCNASKLIANLYNKRARSKNGAVLIDSRIKTVNEIINKKEKERYSILELGCGNGSNLMKLRDHLQSSFKNFTFDYTGVDIRTSVSFSNNDKGVEFIDDDAINYLSKTSKKYDIILHYELIEHLIDPYNFMVILNSVCNSSGYIIFTTPNAEGLEMNIDYNEYRLLAHALFPPMHLNAFSSFNISLFAHLHGFKLYELTTPGQLDVDIINNTNIIDSQIINEVKKMDEYSQAVLQELCILLKASSHMQVILKK